MSIESVIKQNNESMEKVGWYAHCVPGGDNTPFGFNYHTHGMERSWGHRNIQIVMPLDFTVCHTFANVIVAAVKKGMKFEPNVDYPDIAGGGYTVRFIEAKECGRSVLRMIIPDKNHKYEGDFAEQLTLLDNQEGLLEEEKEKSNQFD